MAWFYGKKWKICNKRMVGIETVTMEAEDNPFIAFSLGEVKANTKEEAEQKFKQILRGRIRG